MAALSFDVAISGGGIAGSTLGLMLARTGFGVLIVERERVFRDRVRGESIHPWGVAEAHRSGIASVLQQVGALDLPIWQRYEARVPVEPYAWADDSIDGRPEVSVGHPALQEAMLSAAARAGATVLRPAKVVAFRGGIRPELDISGPAGAITAKARLVVGADGRASAARGWTGGVSVQDPMHHRIGGALFDGIRLDDTRAHDTMVSGGRLIAFPQRHGRARVYAVVALNRHEAVRRDRTGAALASFCDQAFPGAAFAGARTAGPVAFFPGSDTWASVVAGNGVVLIGDAAGANDPSVGQGLSIAFRDARLLSDLLGTESDPNRAAARFAEERFAYYDVLRAHARWVGALILDEGVDADRRRERVARARERDPTAGGFALIFARGPDGLTADDAARRRFFADDE